MTKSQKRMLFLLADWGGHGTCELECQWGGYDFGDSEAAEAKAWRVTRLVVSNLLKSLERRGLATEDGISGTPELTDKGAALVEKMKRRGVTP